MALVEQQPYNLFATPKLAKPVEVYDPNKGWRGAPSANNINTAFYTPQAQMQIQQQQQPQAQPQTQKVTPVQPQITSMDDLVNAMYTSPQEEERMRRASVANQRILAIGDALRHIGNIANTINYAPAQKLNSPVLEEEARYKQGKALRDKANLTYMNYQQAKAAQDAKARQWEQQFQLNIANAASQDAYRREMARAAGERAANQKAYQEGNLARQKQADADRKAYNEARLKQDKWYKGGMLGVANRRVKDQERRTTAYVNKVNNGGGRGSNPYTFPTKNGYINLGRDLNTNQIGKKALFGEMKKAGIIDNVWETRYKNMFDAQQQSALLNTAISQWLMTDDKAEEYMKKHFGASSISSADSMDLGLEDDEDEMDLGLD